MHFKDKVAWITGASSGIGEAIAIQLAKEGASLILTSRNEQALHALASICNAHGGRSFVLPADLSNLEAHEELTEKAISFIGRIDIIIHSAGVTQRSLAENTEMHVYRTLMEINFFAPVSLSKQILPHFTQNQSGHIVVISSMAGLMGFPKRTGYAAAKHALKGYFETLQTENSVRGISVTIAYPGRINTPISTNALLGDGEKHGKMDKGQLNGIPVNVCAARIIRAIKLKKKKVIIAQGERLLFWFWWFLPTLYHRIARKTGMKDDIAK